ncbi:MAG TPA: hypothetical protein VGF82_20735 [Terracidiphilus sp.]|jgi:hypothetical protein
MALCDDCFEDFVHPLWHELKEKNGRFSEKYGRHKRWHWDEEAVTLTFSDRVLPTVRIDVSIDRGRCWLLCRNIELASS